MVFNLSYVQTNNWRRQKMQKIKGNFNHHANVVVQYGTHDPMEHIQGFTRSHWMPPSGECLCLCAVLPRRLPFSTNLLKKNITLPKN
jgi:hypothetical protein